MYSFEKAKIKQMLGADVYNMLEDLILEKKRTTFTKLKSSIEELSLMAANYTCGQKYKGSYLSVTDVFVKKQEVFDEIWEAMWIYEVAAHKYKDSK